MILTGPAAQRVAKGNHPDFDVIVRSSVSVDRNLAGTGCVNSLERAELLALGRVLSSAARAAGIEVAPAGLLDPWFRSNLVERGLYSRSYLLDEENFVALGPELPSWLEFNDHNHVSIHESLPGLALEKAWDDVSALDDRLSYAVGSKAWAFDPHLGYIMEEVAFCGSGLAASVSLHTPALVLSGLAETAIKKVMEAGFIVSGSYSVHAPSAGALFELALPLAYHDPERVSLRRLSAAALTLAEYERRARMQLLSATPWDILDVAGRAVGRAVGAWLLSRDEAADIVSGLRLGVACGIVDGPGLETITDLWSSLSARFAPRSAVGTDEVESENEPEAARRATALRHAVSGARISERYAHV